MTGARRGRAALPADADAVIAAARAWVGTPYHAQASLRGVGADCIGLVRGVWRDVVGPEVLAVPHYTRDWGEVGTREVLRDSMATAFIEVPVAEAAPGDLLLFRMRRTAIAKHVGILIAADRFVHSYERVGVIEDHLSDAWQRRIAFAFRFPRAKRTRKKES